MPEILIVDDNEFNIKSVDRLLSKEGFNVVAATNGKEALRLLESFCFDLLVTDLSMPLMSGTDLVRHIKDKEEWAEMPIIVMSSRADERSRVECYNLGIDIYLSKPVSPTELVAKIKSLMKDNS
jgi:CheY-like chemotaxis protein